MFNAIGGGTIFKVREPEFLKSKMAPGAALARCRGCLRGDVPPSEVGAFFKMWAQMKRFGALFFIFLNI